MQVDRKSGEEMERERGEVRDIISPLWIVSFYVPIMQNGTGKYTLNLWKLYSVLKGAFGVDDNLYH